MKIFHKKSLSIALVITIVAGSSACATQGTTQVQSSRDEYAATIEPERTYVVEFARGEKKKVKGADLTVRENLVGIRAEGEAEPCWYTRDQISSLVQLNGSHIVRGMAIGAGVGAVATGAVGAVWGATMECAFVAMDESPNAPSGSCGGETAMKAGLIGAGIGAVAGMGIGAIIGSVIPKKSKQILVTPQVSSGGDRGTYGGVNVGMKF